jgi:hypothetical protein
MTGHEILRLLSELDDPEHWEHPAGFDYPAMQRDFRSLAAHLGDLFSFPSEIYDGYPGDQDCSHFGDIIIPGDKTASQQSIGVRVSNFRPLVTYAQLYRVDWNIHPLDATVLDRVMESNGFIPVPGDLLHRPYDGVLALGRDTTWFTRFFDWQ